MSLGDFDRCTPEEFRAIYDQWQRRDQYQERGKWERIRMLCLCVLQPYAKDTLKPSDVMRLPWDEEQEAAEPEAADPEFVEDINARFAAAKARYGLH